MQNEKVHLIIDNRENKLKALFDKKKDIVTYESQQLDIADIIITNEVAIERKEGFDFVSSIMDNRLFEQLLRLKDTYEHPILILEGLNDKVFENTGMKISSIYGALAYISYNSLVFLDNDLPIHLVDKKQKPQKANQEKMENVLQFLIRPSTLS